MTLVLAVLYECMLSNEFEGTIRSAALGLSIAGILLSSTLSVYFLVLRKREEKRDSWQADVPRA